MNSVFEPSQLIKGSIASNLWILRIYQLRCKLFFKKIFCGLALCFLVIVIAVAPLFSTTTSSFGGGFCFVFSRFLNLQAGWGWLWASRICLLVAADSANLMLFTAPFLALSCVFFSVYFLKATC